MAINTKSKELLVKILIVVSIVMMIVSESSNLSVFEDAIANTMFSDSLSRLFGGLLFILLMYLFGLGKLVKCNGSVKLILIVLIPGLLVAVNNFPIIAYFDQRAYLTEPSYTVYLFLFLSLCVGLFEELIFRGIVLMILVQRLPKTRKGLFQAVIYSALIFSLMHVLNLFAGAGLGPTLLQIGYSFLMGLLWAVVYVVSKNIWVSVILHASYNFFGQVMFQLGVVSNRYDTVTVVITVLLGCIVAVFMGYLLYNTDIAKVEEHFAS